LPLVQSLDDLQILAANQTRTAIHGLFHESKTRARRGFFVSALTVSPNNQITAGVEHREHEDAICVLAKIYTVRKSPSYGAAQPMMDLRK